jgi:polyisoprenoid-binding protein YceI
MSNRTFIYGIAAIILLGIGAVGGVLVSNAIFAGDGEASEEISAPTLDPNVTPTPGYSQVVATNEALQAELDTQRQIAEDAQQTAQAVVAMAETVTEEATEEPTEQVTEDPTAETDASTTEEDANMEDAASDRVLFRIIQDESEVRFNIDEVLAGQDVIVVGTTDQVAGDVVVDFGAPGSSQIGTIRINVRTLETDNNFRNQAIRGRILESSRDEFEFAEFVPTDLVGLPDAVAVGETVSFQIIGDLSLRDVTRQVTFDTDVTLTSEDRIEGFATTTILYQDFNLTIPDVPSVSFVADEVILEIDFVATKVDA